MSETQKRVHTPVLLEEIVAMAKAVGHPPRWLLDGTFGRGGHTVALLNAFPELQAIGLDRDQAAIEYGLAAYSDLVTSGRLHLVQGNFHHFTQIKAQALAAITAGRGFDLMLLDLGVSSPQLDRAERGFSFYNDGPLDMRMDQGQQLTAADIVNTWSESELVTLFQDYGEIRRPQRAVQKIIETRREKPFTTTRELASLLEKSEGWGRPGHHPATRFFLALRLEVNQELDGLEPSISPLIAGLVPEGRLMIITFHSLEDRIIKYAFREREYEGVIVTRKVIAPTREECKRNPRARSAKLRVFAKGTGIGEST